MRYSTCSQQPLLHLEHLRLYLVICDCLQDPSPLHASDLCKSDELQKFKELTLADLKVMGIVGKVCVSIDVQYVPSSHSV